MLAIRQGVPCADCRAVVRIDGRAGVSVLAGEAEVPAGLSAARVDIAVAQAGRFVVAGPAGVYAYDPVLRAWRTLSPDAVTAHWAAADGARLVLASGDSVLTVTGAAPTRTQTVAAPIRQIAGAEGRVIGLDTEGRVIDLTLAEASVLIPADPGPPVAQFRIGAAQGDVLLALGSGGLLIHDARARRYAFQPAQDVPAAILQAREPRLYGADSGLWHVDHATGMIHKITLSGTLARPDGCLHRRHLAAAPCGSGRRRGRRPDGDGGGWQRLARAPRGRWNGRTAGPAIGCPDPAACRDRRGE